MPKSCVQLMKQIGALRQGAALASGQSIEDLLV